MITSWTRLEVKKGEKSYYVMCPPDAQLGELHDAICELRQIVINRIIHQQNLEQELLKKREETQTDVVPEVIK